MFSRMLSVVALAGLVSAAIVPAISTIEKRTGTIVNLRIEGATDTLYEAPIFTYPHNVTTPSGAYTHIVPFPAQANSAFICPRLHRHFRLLVPLSVDYSNAC